MPDQTPPPPAPSAQLHQDDRASDKASGGMRALAVLLAVALAFGAAVMIVIALNPDDIPRCEETARAAAAAECFDISQAQQTIGQVLAWPAGIIGAAAALVALAVAATGRHGRTLLRLTLVAAVLAGVVVLVGQL